MRDAKFLGLLLAVLLVGCEGEGDLDGDAEAVPIEAGPVTAGDVTAGDVTATGAITLTGDIAGGDVLAGDVSAGTVEAGDVSAGDVSAGAVTATGAITASGAVTAGTVEAGDVSAGDVEATGAVTLSGPVTASGGLGADVLDVEMVFVQCNGGGCPSGDYTAALQAACGGSGGTLLSVDFTGGPARTNVGSVLSATIVWGMLAAVECL